MPCAAKILFILLVQLGYCFGALAPTNLLATRVGPCLKNRSQVVTVSEMSIYTRIYDSSVSGRFNITETIGNGWDVRATMLKCQDIRNLDTCDFFRAYQVVKIGCSDNSTAEDEDLYNMFFHHTTPRLSCPIQPGRYKIVAYPFFTEDNYRTVSEAKISTSVFGYTYKLEGYLGPRRLFCVESYLQLLYVREHNWMSDSAVAETSAEDDDGLGGEGGKPDTEDDEDADDVKHEEGEGLVYT